MRGSSNHTGFGILSRKKDCIEDPLWIINCPTWLITESGRASSVQYHLRSTKIDRKDFTIMCNKKVDVGEVLLADEVTFNVEMETRDLLD